MDAVTEKPTFKTSGLEFTGECTSFTDGLVWTRSLWDFDHSRCLQRDVSAGKASIKECGGSGGNFMLNMRVLPDVPRADMEATLFFETARAAAEAAEAFAWTTKDHAGVMWYQTNCSDDGYTVWQAVLGEGDKVTLSHDKDGEYRMKRNISVCYGMSYEMSATRYDAGDTKLAVRTFEEAAAIAITLPSFLAILGATK
ncbi:MAG: hypothetical protein PHQ60_02235 [Sideroxydans sp.]|nr:hypothetical protein [Sideroxydans sp.]MDD5056662.1 hypothetical protein [Sideroxydans sp.]